MCAQVVSRVLERILMGDNDPSMLNVGAGATHGSVQVALVRVARGGRSGRVAAKCQGCCVAAFGHTLASCLMQIR